MRKQYTVIIVLTILFSACAGTKYIIPDFETKTAGHKKIAILPFDMVYTGRIPERLQPADVEEIRYAEAKAFQKGLYNAIGKEREAEKNNIKIEIQSPDKTNQLLQDSGLKYLELSTASPHEICRKLGVDAVVYTKIEKERLLSDLQVFGVTISDDVMEKLRLSYPELNNNLPEIPGNVERTYHIKTVCELKNSGDGLLLWMYTDDVDESWSAKAEKVIAQITTRSAKKFPYRNR